MPPHLVNDAALDKAPRVWWAAQDCQATLDECLKRLFKQGLHSSVSIVKNNVTETPVPDQQLLTAADLQHATACLLELAKVMPAEDLEWDVCSRLFAKVCHKSGWRGCAHGRLCGHICKVLRPGKATTMHCRQRDAH